MQTGMMWLKTDKKSTLPQEIARAVDYYIHKYGKKPNTCLINPNMLNGDLEPDEGQPYLNITVRPYRPILPGHLWIGVEQAAGAVEKRSAELVEEATDAKANVERVIQAVIEL